MPQGGLAIYGAGLQLQQVSPGTANVGNFNISGRGIAANFDTRNAPTAGAVNDYFGITRTFGNEIPQGAVCIGSLQKVGGAGGYTPQFVTLIGSSANSYCQQGTAVGNASSVGLDRGDVAQNNPHCAFGYSVTVAGDAGDFTAFGNTGIGSQSSAQGRRVYTFGWSNQATGTGQSDLILIGAKITTSGNGLVNAIIIDSESGGKTIQDPADSNSIQIGNATHTKIRIGGMAFSPAVTVADAPYVFTAGITKAIYTTLTAARAITLPAANSVPPGFTCRVIDATGAASGVNTLTLTRAGGDTINGVTTKVINTAYGSAEVTSDGVSRWTVTDSL